jgi:hypothetical protein
MACSMDLGVHAQKFGDAATLLLDLERKKFIQWTTWRVSQRVGLPLEGSLFHHTSGRLSLKKATSVGVHVYASSGVIGDWHELCTNGSMHSAKARIKAR